MMHPCGWYKDVSIRGSPGLKGQQHHSLSGQLNGWHCGLETQISWVGVLGSSGIIHEIYASWPTGCLPISDSLTVGEFRSFGLTGSSRWRMPPFSSLDKRSRAALHFPMIVAFGSIHQNPSLSLLPRPHRKGLGTKLAIDTKSVAIKPLQINL